MRFGSKDKTLFRVRAESMEAACGMFGAIAGAGFVEGCKALRVRQKMGLEMPYFAEQPLDGFLKVSLKDTASMNAMAGLVARYAGTGLYCVKRDYLGLPDHFQISDDDAIAAFAALVCEPPRATGEV